MAMTNTRGELRDERHRSLARGAHDRENIDELHAFCAIDAPRTDTIDNGETRSALDEIARTRTCARGNFCDRAP